MVSSATRSLCARNSRSCSSAAWPSRTATRSRAAAYGPAASRTGAVSERSSSRRSSSIRCSGANGSRSARSASRSPTAASIWPRTRAGASGTRARTPASPSRTPSTAGICSGTRLRTPANDFSTSARRASGDGSEAVLSMESAGASAFWTSSRSGRTEPTVASASGASTVAIRPSFLGWLENDVLDRLEDVSEALARGQEGVERAPQRWGRVDELREVAQRQLGELLDDRERVGRGADEALRLIQKSGVDRPERIRRRGRRRALSEDDEVVELVGLAAALLELERVDDDVLDRGGGDDVRHEGERRAVVELGPYLVEELVASLVAVEAAHDRDARGHRVEVLVQARRSARHLVLDVGAPLERLDRLDPRDLPVAENRLDLHSRSTPWRRACSVRASFTSPATSPASTSSRRAPPPGSTPRDVGSED